MKVKKISIANVEVDALPELLDKEKIGFQTIDNVKIGRASCRERV